MRRGCLGQEGPAPTLACSAQMAGAAATSWAALLRRSLWGDIPFPTGPGKALVSSSLEPAFFLGCGLPPPPQHGWQAPGLLGSRPPPPGPGPWKGWVLVLMEETSTWATTVDTTFLSALG